MLVWQTGGLTLHAVEPSRRQMRLAAHQISLWYSDPHNQATMNGPLTQDAQDVLEFFTDLQTENGRYFLLFCDGKLVGDGDFRHIHEGHAEYTLMIGARDQQGQGLGTRFSLMLHAFAFGVLQLSAVYLAVTMGNQAGRRCYEKLGYVPDDTPLARSYAQLSDDLTMVLSAEVFWARHGGQMPAFRRGSPTELLVFEATAAWRLSCLVRRPVLPVQAGGGGPQARRP